QQEQREQRALLRSPDRERSAVHPNRERTEDPKLEAARCHCAQPRVSSTYDLDTRGRDAGGTALGQLWDTTAGRSRPMLYTAKCFWPGVTEDELRLAATRAGSETRERPQATFRGAL